MALLRTEEKRQFVMEATSQLAAARTVTLSAETAAGLSEICQNLSINAEQVGANEIAHFMIECKTLCGWILRRGTQATVAKADELLKNCFVEVRTAILDMTSCGATDARKGQFDTLESKICEMRCELQSSFDFSAQVAPAENTGEEKQVVPSFDIDTRTSEELGESEHCFFSTLKTSPAEKLFVSIAKLTEKVHQNEELREMAFDVACAARAAHSFRFSMVCGGVETDTPDALLDENHVRVVREQLTAWLKQGAGDSRAIASLRQIGGTLWLELRQPNDDVGSDAARGELLQGVNGVSVSENYVTPKETWIRRGRLDLLLPTFKAYEASYAGRVFLIPTGDVESVFSVAPSGFERVSLGTLLDLPDEWRPEKDMRTSMIIKCRGSSFVVEAESVEGPRTYLARNVVDAGPELRGVVGTARLSGGRKGIVLDLYPWLEAYQQRVSELKKHEERQQTVGGKYMVFKVAGRRYAVPFACVKSVGRVENESILTGMVETKAGLFHLYDIRGTLGLEGEAGGVYVATQTKVGAVAWQVDAVEPACLVTPGDSGTSPKLRLAPFGYAHRGGRVDGLIRGVLPNSEKPISSATTGGSVPGAPIYLLDVDRLAPSGRPIRRFA